MLSQSNFLRILLYLLFQYHNNNYYYYQSVDASVNSAIIVTFVIEENVAIGSEVGRIQLDPEMDKPTKVKNTKDGKSDEITFTLQDTYYFDFDTTYTDRILVRRELDRDTDRKLCSESGWPEICAWSGVIFVSDGRLLSLRIVIRDVNDNIPKWPSKDSSEQPVLEVWITENRPFGSTLDLPLAFDPDIGENSIVKYELASSNNNVTSTFKISNSASPNGPIYHLIVQGELDRETLSVYHLTVAAVDGGGNRGYAKLLVNIADENDNSPIFEHCKNLSKLDSDVFTQPCEIVISVDEDIPIGSLLPEHPVASDADEGEFGHVTYRFSLSASDTARRDFKIDHETGAIIVRGPLDYDTGGQTQYTFGIVAEDGGLPPLSATTRIIVNIRDKNDNAPQITITPAFLYDEKYNTTVDTTKSLLRLIENTPPGVLIATITAHDPDSDENGKFTCELGQTDELNLIYLRNLGKISVYQLSSLRIIDREIQPELRVTLKCEDNGIPSQKSIEILTIRILDMNDNPPKYTNKRFSFQVPENNDVGLVIGEVTALDPDLGPNGALNYSIHWPPGQGPNPFEINTKGELITRMPLDRENQPEGYHFIVNAYDNGQPCLSGSTHVEVALIDINDCRPIFTHMNYHFSIDEELKVNSTEPYVIGQVKATDCDIGLNAHLVYSMDPTSQSADNPFQVTADGYVTTTQSIDRETHPAFLLQVIATDSPQQVAKKLTATAQVHITILDNNDNEPVFQRPPFDNGTDQVEISYNDVPGHLVTRVEASDKDVGVNGRVKYSFTGNHSVEDLFKIRQNSGEIFLQRELSVKDMGTVSLVILATDMGIKPKTSTATIYVKISDIPSNAFRLNSLRKSDSLNNLSTSIFPNFSVDANKLIIICIILVTFIICTVLISVIFTISHGRCQLFTKTSKTTNHYNDNPVGYNTDLVEKSPSQMTYGVLNTNKPINYPFDSEDINSFEHNTSYLPSFYDQTLSVTMPYTSFPDTGLRFYDPMLTDSEQLVQSLHGGEKSIQLHTSSASVLDTDQNGQMRNNMTSVERTTFPSRIFTNYCPTYKTTKLISYGMNDSSAPINNLSQNSNILVNNKNNFSQSTSKYTGSTTHVSITFPSNSLNPVIPRRDSQTNLMTSGYLYGNFEDMS
ncbi:unnamed protein product [Heterobilharzia americana]|nr:unnamed protein product [Heterobilharzia americana]